MCVRTQDFVAAEQVSQLHCALPHREDDPQGVESDELVSAPVYHLAVQGHVGRALRCA